MDYVLIVISAITGMVTTHDFDNKAGCVKAKETIEATINTKGSFSLATKVAVHCVPKHVPEGQ